MGPSFAGTENPSSAPTRGETRTPSSLEGGVTGFRPGECWMRVGHGSLCRGSIPLCRAGTGGLLFFSEKKGPPPCATSSRCRLCTCLAGPSGKVGSCGIGDAGVCGGWQCRSSFRSAPSTLSHHKKKGPIPARFLIFIWALSTAWISPRSRLRLLRRSLDSQRSCKTPGHRTQELGTRVQGNPNFVSIVGAQLAPYRRPTGALWALERPYDNLFFRVTPTSY